ncbi:hypothetical protein HY772_06435 [Candidatus Woesearchaeota archaeon]|nr:hypothetical protein [Candidatus Woesearchaeota archaeon]
MGKTIWLKRGLLVFLAGLMVIGYGFSCPLLKKKKKSVMTTETPTDGSSGETGTISDGTMEGIGSYVGLISATINCDPNSGPYGTPVTITITFTKGGSYVNSIKVYQKLVGGSYIYYSGVDPVKQSANVWVSPEGIGLTGNAGWLKFVGVNSGGTEIVLGIIEVNNPY